MVSVAEAAFEGRLALTPGGTDFQAYYETTTNLTWAANANLLGDTSQPLRNWGESNEWMATLNIGGVTGWRLPSTIWKDFSCSVVGNDSNGLGCTGSEMGYLFNVLGISAASSGPFSGLQSATYWSNTSFGSNSAYTFDFGSGEQSINGAQSPWRNMWAVQTGDVGASAVPIPAAAWLFGSALIGLVGVKRRN